mgnify:CR=1 FL=1
MTPEQVERLLARMERLGYNTITVSLAAGKKRGWLHDVLSGRAKSPSVDALVALCKVLGMSTAELLDGQIKLPLRVPIIGEIAYSDIWRQYNSGKKLPEIIDLWTTNDDLIAVRVVDSSMAPRFQKNDIVLGNRVIGNNADNYIGLHCIIKTADERTFIKVITRGSKPNYYTLRSLDPSTPDIEDVEIVWFAPVVSIMPQSQ